MSWVQTFTGKRFDLLDPKPEQICIQDIAHSLSNLCRYHGHSRTFYSVAEHSLNVYELVSRQTDNLLLKRTALMHDAMEAYVGDMAAPLKQLVPDYREIEDHVWRIIARKFDLPEEMPAEVKRADLAMLATEQPIIVGPQVARWHLPEEAIKDWHFFCWGPLISEGEFFGAARELKLV